MTRTLTLERQQFEKWWETAMHNGYPPRFGWEHWRDGDGYRDDDGEFQGLWQAWQASRGFLANREAQPVALDVIARFKDWNTGFPVEKFKSDYVIGWVLANYYAPPAPAVPDFEAWFVEKYKQPERLVKNEDGTYKFSGVQMAFSAWNACRAAMLAQPVSSGYTFNSPVIPDGWKLVPVEPTEDMLRAAYRESGVYSAKAYRAMLAAAPEGGNDHDTGR
ncbi:hypothetical protein LL394_001064 [Serratia marcescens]|uniref:hypothetical protein n=1 Tax=Serratia marcescens TaxID=615 RepID=UPI00074521E8|nr:hypothetical protein [Serratia marcescens]MDP8619154.1 hypothetical protein [Serratia marcescens]CUY57826.1 Uncharacterised protein [Serratia marcescens]